MTNEECLRRFAKDDREEVARWAVNQIDSLRQQLAEAQQDNAALRTAMQGMADERFKAERKLEDFAGVLGEHPDSDHDYLIQRIVSIRHEARDYCNVAARCAEAEREIQIRHRRVRGGSKGWWIMKTCINCKGDISKGGHYVPSSLGEPGMWACHAFPDSPFYKPQPDPWELCRRLAEAAADVCQADDGGAFLYKNKLGQYTMGNLHTALVEYEAAVKDGG